MQIFLTLLSYDHGILRQVLDVLGDIGENDTWEQHRDALPEAVDFLSRFMDQYHHGKEERFLFPASAEGPEHLKEEVENLIQEHQTARDYVAAIDRNLQEWNIPILRENIDALVAHMRHHINDEEREAFPQFESVLGPEQDHQLYEEGQKFMEEEFGPSFQRDMEGFANRLQDRIMGKGVIKYVDE